MQAIDVALRRHRRAGRQRARLLRRRHAARLRDGGDEGERRGQGGERHAAHHAARFLRPRRDRRAGDRGEHRRARGGDRQGRRHGGQGARAHVLVAARQRPHLVVRRQQLPQGQEPAGVRPAVLERATAPTCPGPMFCWYVRNTLPREQPARAGQDDPVRRPRGPVRDRRPRVRLRVARGPHRALAHGLRDRRSCSAATTRSCWARAGTSPAWSIRRRRTSAITGSAAMPAPIPSTGSRPRATCPEAGGRCTASGWRGRAAARSPRPPKLGSKRHRRLRPAPGRYVVEKAERRSPGRARRNPG